LLPWFVTESTKKDGYQAVSNVKAFLIWILTMAAYRPLSETFGGFWFKNCGIGAIFKNILLENIHR
jgi:hypothetical protein